MRGIMIKSKGGAMSNLIEKEIQESQKFNLIEDKETGLIECKFCFSQRFREFFSVQTGIKNFKFNADMVATSRKVKEEGDKTFTLGDMLEVFYGRKTYAKYDKSCLQWNKFVKMAD